MRDSSLEAHESIKPKKESHYKIIKDGLRKAKEKFKGGATAYQISAYCNLTYHQVMRRTSEMEEKGMIKVVGRATDIVCKPMIWDFK